MKEKVKLYVATPVHSDVSIHYMQSVVRLQAECYKNNIEFVPVWPALEALAVTSGVTIVALAALTIAAPGRVRGVRGTLSRGRGPV